jgi:hypothetical protein
MTIDMKEFNFTGESQDPAAEGQQILTNSYQEEFTNEEFPLIKDLLEPPVAEQPKAEIAQEAAPEEPSKQELNFRALREEVDRIKAERDEFKQNIELLKANSRQQEQYRPAPPEPERKLFDGMDDGDIPNVAEIRKAWETREAEYLGRIEELSVAQQHSDYAEVLEKYTAPLIRQKPHLVEGIQGARNKALFAYELGKLYQNQQQVVSTPPPSQQVQQPTSPSATAQRIVENSRRPGTLSSSGGQGALSKADFIATMSDRDFMEMATKHLDQI